ncbi:hypothetical protein AB1Y20_007465 [Prymnesium parvum]|uniref:Acyltransferase n=1 Tax=Prymnesium parvum TaxID=97485 RepID=A0AB34IVD1_PRYPA
MESICCLSDRRSGCIRVNQLSQHCIECFAADPAVLRLPRDERRRVVYAQKKSCTSFEPGSLAWQANISLVEEAAVLCAFFVLMGGPLILFATGFVCLLVGSWLSCLVWLALVLVLAMHPLPDCAESLRQSWFALTLYKYFSYRFVWSNDDDLATQDLSSAWYGAGPPHGVLPLANLLSIPAINSFAFRPFVGAPASVVFHTPFLRYMTLFGAVDVSAKSMAKAAASGLCVGIVPDGIAGIFKNNESDEVVFLKNRKGLAKLALRTGTPILPAYSVGNTAVFTAWFDPFGMMENLSRKAQASVFFFWGRFYLPLPRRVNITMLFGRPIVVEKVSEPTSEQIDALHAQYLRAIETLFETHKEALGWGRKTLRFV